MKNKTDISFEKVLLVSTFCFFLFLSSGAAFLKAQTPKQDSLQKILLKSQKDTFRVNVLNALSWELKSNNADTAIILAKQAYDLASQLNFIKGTVDAQINSGVAYMYIGEYDITLQNLNKAIEIIKNNPSFGKLVIGKKLLAKAQNNIGNINNLQGNFDNAVRYYNISLETRKEIGDKQGVADSYNNIAGIFYNRGNYLEALKNFKEALVLKESLLGPDGKPEDMHGLGNAYNNIGAVHNHLGNNSESVRYHYKALKIKEEIGDKAGISSVYVNMGLIYEEQENYVEALKNFNLSLKIDEEIGDRQGIALCKINIGNVYNSLKKFQESLKSHEEALKIMRDLGQKKEIGNCYINIGGIYNHLGKTEEAMKNFVSALALYENMENIQGMASANNNIGRIYMAQKNYKAARPYIERSMEFSKRSSIKSYIKSAYSNLSDLDRHEALSGTVSLQRKAELLLSALYNYDKYIIYRDSLVNEEISKKTVEQKMQHEFDKRESLAQAEHDKQIANAEADKKRQRLVLIMVVIVALAVSGIAFVVFRTLRVTRKQKVLIEIKSKETEEQKSIIEEKQKEIIDSIHYARRIQRSLLASEKYIVKSIERLKSGKEK